MGDLTRDLNECERKRNATLMGRLRKEDLDDGIADGIDDLRTENDLLLTQVMDAEEAMKQVQKELDECNRQLGQQATVEDDESGASGSPAKTTRSTSQARNKRPRRTATVQTGAVVVTENVLGDDDDNESEEAPPKRAKKSRAPVEKSV